MTHMCLLADLGMGAEGGSTDPACSASSDSSAMLHMFPLLLPLCCGGLLHTSTSAKKEDWQWSRVTLICCTQICQ